MTPQAPGPHVLGLHEDTPVPRAPRLGLRENTLDPDPRGFGLRERTPASTRRGEARVVSEEEYTELVPPTRPAGSRQS